MFILPQSEHRYNQECVHLPVMQKTWQNILGYDSYTHRISMITKNMIYCTWSLSVTKYTWVWQWKDYLFHGIYFNTNVIMNLPIMGCRKYMTQTDECTWLEQWRGLLSYYHILSINIISNKVMFLLAWSKSVTEYT